MESAQQELCMCVNSGAYLLCSVVVFFRHLSYSAQHNFFLNLINNM